MLYSIGFTHIIHEVDDDVSDDADSDDAESQRSDQLSQDDDVVVDDDEDDDGAVDTYSLIDRDIRSG